MYHIAVEMEKRPNGIFLTDQAQNIIFKKLFPVAVNILRDTLRSPISILHLFFSKNFRTSRSY